MLYTIYKMAKANVRDLYQKSFLTDRYHDIVYKEIKPWNNFFMRNAFKMYSSGLAGGKRLLEVGAGSSIHNIAIASAFCETIVTSELLHSSREIIKLWLNNDPSAFDWTAHLTLCAELEGFSNVSEGVTEIAKRLRSKVTDVVFCDITNKYPLEKPMEPFDVIITSLCCDSAVQTHEEYMTVVKNISNLLRPKGKIISCGKLNCNYYVVANVKFPCCPVNENLVKKSFIDAGFNVLQYKESEIFQVSPDFDPPGTRKMFIGLFEKL